MEPIPINKLLDLAGKTAIVTGGARGIGFAIAKRLAEAGAKTVVADLKLEEAEKSAAELTSLNLQAKAVSVDVSNEDQVQKMVDDTIGTFSTIDILVNDAGIFPSTPISEMSAQDFDHVIATNLRSVFLTTKKVSEKMITQGKGGKIINITSIDALHPSSVGLAHYDASKHGVWGFTKNSALELSKHKIWVNAIAPGGIATPGVAEAQKSAPVPNGVDMAKVMEAFIAKIPLGRIGEPDDIAKVALFLASDMSSYMTGSQVVVDGGFLLS